MRKLTLSKKIEDGEFRSIQRNYDIVLPQEFIEFMQVYANSGVIENQFKDESGQLWQISKFCPFKTIYDFIGYFKDNNLGIKIPFAFDYGGWIFCLCLDKEDYKSIFIYRFTDHLPQEAFIKIADSFEEFINGLKPISQVP